MLRKLLPHICLDISVIFLVLWVLDRFNGAMHFLSRDVFKIPFGIFLVLVFILSVQSIARQRKDDRQ